MHPWKLIRTKLYTTISNQKEAIIAQNNNFIKWAYTNCKNGPLENIIYINYKSMLNDTMVTDEIVREFLCYSVTHELNTVGISPMMWLS